MIDGWEIKIILIYNGLVVNICYHKFSIQIKEKYVGIPPLDESTFRIRAYDSAFKNLVGITIIIIIIEVRIIAVKFQVVDSKLSYNLFLLGPWLHDMDVIPSTLNDILKFEYQGEVHTTLGDLEHYSLCNIIYFEELQ